MSGRNEAIWRAAYVGSMLSYELSRTASRVPTTSIILCMSTSRYQWRQREFKVGGGRSDEGDESLPACPGRGVWEGQIFCDLEMAYFGDSEVLNLKVFSAR